MPIPTIDGGSWDPGVYSGGGGDGSIASIINSIGGLANVVVSGLQKAGVFGQTAQNQAIYTGAGASQPWVYYNPNTGTMTNYGPLLILGAFGIAAILLLRR